jgi:hypothetical protein
MSMSELFTPESLQMMKRFEENFQYYAKHYNELREKYRGKFIAIDQGKIIAENSDHSQLLEYLSKEYKDTRPIFIQYISEKDYMIMV